MLHCSGKTRAEQHIRDIITEPNMRPLTHPSRSVHFRPSDLPLLTFLTVRLSFNPALGQIFLRDAALRINSAFCGSFGPAATQRPIFGITYGVKKNVVRCQRTRATGQSDASRGTRRRPAIQHKRSSATEPGTMRPAAPTHTTRPGVRPHASIRSKSQRSAAPVASSVPPSSLMVMN